MTSVPVKGLVGFFVAYGNAITAATGISSVIAVGSWSLSSLKKDIEINKKDIEVASMRHQKDIEINKKGIELASIRHQKDVEINKKDVELAAMRVERDVANKLLDLTFTEEMKSFRESLASKRQAEATRANR